MSSICFNSPSGKVYISGTERAWMGSLLRRCTAGRWDGGSAGFARALDTAIREHPALKCVMFIHGLCEVHGFIEGHDRQWFADRIEESLYALVRLPDECNGALESVEVMRLAFSAAGYDGWLRLVAWLRANDYDPVVMSYSVGESFPPSPLQDDWPKAMDQLREQPDFNINPKLWETIVFDELR